jgi:N-carbamoylputrescine amidase
MTSTLNVAVLQCRFSDQVDLNVARVVDLVREAAARGAQIVLPPELFEGPYFPRQQSEAQFSLARPVADHPTLATFRSLAKELNVAIPVSFFERAGQAYYNSLAMIDSNGALLGVYRKSHIPDGPGYQEKYYFRPGDTGFRTWPTRRGALGVGICWDQWFPECARALALQGAELLLYPTAIGSEPVHPELDTKDMWQRVMIGHAVANMMPVAAANRVGVEGDQQFYGHSFIANHRGEIVQELGRDDEGVLCAVFDRDAIAADRAGFGFFRDRRPELYRILTTADGQGGPGDKKDEPA